MLLQRGDLPRQSSNGLSGLFQLSVQTGKRGLQLTDLRVQLLMDARHNGCQYIPGFRVPSGSGGQQRVHGGIPPGQAGLGCRGPELLCKLVELALSGAVLGLAAVQLVQGAAQPPLACPVLRQAVLVLLQAVLVLGIAVLVFVQAVLVVPAAIVVFLPAIVQLRPGVRQLLLVVVQLHQGVVQLRLAVSDLLLCLCHLVLQLPDAVVVFRPAVIQLGPGICQLRPGVGELLLCLRLCVRQLLLCVRQLFVGLADDLLSPEAGPLVGKRLQAVRQAVDPVRIGVVIAEKRFRSFRQQVEVRIGLHGKGAQRQQHKGGHLAGAERRCAPVRAHIQRGVGGAHDGEGLRPQGVRIVAAAGIQGQGVPQLQAGLLQQQRLHQALPGVLRQAALYQPGGVDSGIFCKRENFYNIVVVRQVDHGVHGIGPLHRRHTGLLRQGLRVLVRQTQGGEDMEVHQILLVKIQIRRLLHVRGRGPEPRQEAHCQGGEDQQGEKAAEGVSDLPQSVRDDAVVPQLHTNSSGELGIRS